MAIYKLMKAKDFNVFPNEHTGDYEGYCEFCQTFHSFPRNEIGKVQHAKCEDYLGFNPYSITGIIPVPLHPIYKPNPQHLPLAKTDILKRKRDKVLKLMGDNRGDRYLYFALYPEATPIRFLQDWEALLKGEDIFMWDFTFRNIGEYGIFEEFFIRLHDATKAGNTEKFLHNYNVPINLKEVFTCYGK